tara:strand:+ start:23 stop:694 length:672 start_codon:yes stop_codon:yes gene_type:complete
MFEQKPSKIKEAIADFLRGIDNKSEKEILAKVRHLTKSQTPERSINRTLNELYNKGMLEKLYLKDGTFFSWETLKPEDKYKRFPRYYKLVSEQYRKQVSTSIYCGTNSMGNMDNNPNFNENSNRYRGSDRSPRKTPTDVKAWTFDTIVNRDKDRFDDLAEFLYLKLRKENATCFISQYGVYMSDLSLGEFKAMLGYDGLMPMQNVEESKLFPKIHWSIRDVDQ